MPRTTPPQDHPAAAKTAPEKTKSPRKRAPGRPVADTADLRAQMLEAALACYVRQGIAATSLRDIAREADVTPALVHYYFGDKAQLQEAVVTEKVLPLVLGIREPVAHAGGDIASMVASFVQGIGTIVAEHPWWPALWVREVLCEGGALRGMLIDRVGPQLPQMMAKRFAEAQSEGRLNPDLDPRLLMVSLVGLTMFPLAGAPIWRAMFGAEELDFDDLRRHTLVLLDRGLELENDK
ncbi:TetR/AcrR family transcriptional regulator [Pseudoxanthomonas sp. UTMC 1351]|uniref:TetR/AcrR family transcriptional regulator n=1 Tax=Pseudoxanthomonas sp. UTMC 1351 TaxID=2695853 RepID=UPI0034CEC87A